MKQRIVSMLNDSLSDVFESKIPEPTDKEYDAEYVNSVVVKTKDIQGLINRIELQSGIHGYEVRTEQFICINLPATLRGTICRETENSAGYNVRLSYCFDSGPRSAGTA